MPTVQFSRLRFARLYCAWCLLIFMSSFVSSLPTHAANSQKGATAHALAQPVLAAFQHSILSSRALGIQSKDSISCVAALPKDSFSDMIQDALNQHLSSSDLTAVDAYFSRPAFAAQIPPLLAQMQGLPLTTPKEVRAPLSETDKKLEDALKERDILNKLMLAEYFKTPQVLAAFSAKSNDLLTQCAVRQNALHNPLRPLA